jgi:peptidoglycan/LPS O-acetylase OafA/YrhL
VKDPARHVELLDYVRGIAIISVLFFHTLATVFGYAELPWNGWWRDFSVPPSFLCLLPFSFGQAGVPIFFVVSGFCIHLTFQQQRQSWPGFFIRRFFRIYPPYLAALVFVIFLISANSGFNFSNPAIWTQWLTHLFLLHNFRSDTFFGINGSFWSLAIEAQLYAVYPLLLFLVAKTGWRKTMFLLAGLEVLIQGLSALTQTPAMANRIPGRIFFALAGSPFGYWFSWSLGALIADTFLKKERLPFQKISPLWPLAAAIMSYFVKPLYPFMFLLTALTTAIAVSRLLNRDGQKIETPLPAGAILKNVGLWSYSIYLLHEPLLIYFSYAILSPVPVPHRSAFVVLPLVLVLWLPVIGIGILWYKLFELPAIALGKRMIRKMDVRNAAAFEPNRFLEERRISKPGFSLLIGALTGVTVASYVISAKFTPLPPEKSNNLAWSLATDPDPAKRNGARAVALAEQACRGTHYDEAIMVGTLAAAYAEDGRFDDAIAMARRACQLAAKSGDEKLLKRNQDLLALYLKHQPYHEPPQRAAK